MFSSPSLRRARKLCASDEASAQADAWATLYSGSQFLLGACFAAFLVLSLAVGSLVLSRSFIDARAPAMDEFSLHRLPPPALSLDTVPVDPMVTGSIEPAPRSPRIGLLGSFEFKTERQPFEAVWQSVLDRVTREWLLYAACGEAATKCSPGLRRWQRLIHSVRALSPLEQLRRLNPAINQMAAYAEDTVIYGARDYWASPREFFNRRADCEDYAVVKLFTLLQLGFAPDQLRIAIVRDRSRGVLHAVLTVDLGREIYVMDSLRSEPVEQQFALKYEPIYSINTEGHWAHIVTPQIRSRFVAQLKLRGVVGDRPSPEPKRAEGPQPIVESTLYSPHAVLHAAPG